MWKRISICVLALLAAEQVMAHDWYPMECCSGLDCAVVTEVFHANSGQLAPTALPPERGQDLFGKIGPMFVTTKIGTVEVPDAFPRRRSLDGQWHACMRTKYENGKFAGFRLICLFEPDPA